MKKEILFYGYPKCSTCRAAQAYSNEHGYGLTMHDIKEEPPSKEVLKALLSHSNRPLRYFFNTSGQVYRELSLKDRMDTLTIEEASELLASNGMLIKRPLLYTEDYTDACVGFKENEWEAFFKRCGYSQMK